MTSMRNDKIDSLAFDRKAGIEGLPLIILIGIIIAAVALGILLYWMSSVGDVQTIGKVTISEHDWGGESLKAIGVAPKDYQNFEGTYEIGDTEFIVNVYDAEMNPVSGATVTWTGCGFSGTSITDVEMDGGGDAHIGGGTACLPIGSQEGAIQFKITKSGYSNYEISLAVVRAETAGPMYLYS